MQLFICIITFFFWRKSVISNNEQEYKGIDEKDVFSSQYVGVALTVLAKTQAQQKISIELKVKIPHF
ncbi:hypothetical protein M917_2143 [Psychrobacter aquaticus CMS 56]|uniref:Uncharacterized protein n=1 Tax=Psychrobacter aquaticus CMS 56 TaxID=1354303 RepID=U4T1U2_9GAMM|nr:hypothetical protein M917_2143 [Psychrobacter aquaticus CMS 56]